LLLEPLIVNCVSIAGMRYKSRCHPDAVMDMANIRIMAHEDIPKLVGAFDGAGWHKPYETFEQYLEEQVEGKRLFWLATFGTQISGYITLKWASRYNFFMKERIHELSDLNVLPAFRGMSIGRSLLEIAENAAAQKCPNVEIGVDLYTDYGAAIRLYVRRGYILDGLGMTYRNERVIPGNTVILDDDLILWFINPLKEFQTQ